jgi:hypothetical protein
MPKTAKKTVPKGQIARRLILALVLFSSLITAITTAEQLFVDYRRGVTNIERSFFPGRVGLSGWPDKQHVVL